MNIRSKLPASGNTIFTVMSNLARDHQAINLGQGFPDFETDHHLIELVNKYVSDGKNQYCPMAGLPELRQTLCKKIEHTYGNTLEPDKNICITAGATQAIFTSILAFIHPGDEVIILEPAYDCYKPAISVAGGIVRPYAMVYPDYKVDWDQIKEMITEKTRMIIINTPHNPTGTILLENDLMALEQIIADRDIVVLSDEVYEHIIFDNHRHKSVLRYPRLAEQSISVYSFGKTLHATGWKIGYAVGPEPLMNEFKNIHQWNVFCVNSFLQYAISAYLQNPANYESLPDFYQQKRDCLTELLHGVPLEPKQSMGTYFQLYTYQNISDQDDVTFATYLTKEIGVAAIPLSPFYTNPPGDKAIRLCFAKKEKTLEAAASRLKVLADKTK